MSLPHLPQGIVESTDGCRSKARMPSRPALVKAAACVARATAPAHTAAIDVDGAFTGGEFPEREGRNLSAGQFPESPCFVQKAERLSEARSHAQVSNNPHGEPSHCSDQDRSSRSSRSACSTSSEGCR